MKDWREKQGTSVYRDEPYRGAKWAEGMGNIEMFMSANRHTTLQDWRKMQGTSVQGLMVYIYTKWAEPHSMKDWRKKQGTSMQGRTVDRRQVGRVSQHEGLAGKAGNKRVGANRREACLTL